MITAFRKALEGPLKWVFLGLVVLAFAAFGDFDLPGFTSQDALRVGDRGYGAAEVDRAFAQRLAQAQQERPTLTRDEAVSAGLLETTLSQLTAQALIGQEAERLGLTATDGMVQRYLRESGIFDDPRTGEFSAAALAEGLRQNGITPSQFRDDIKQDLVRGQIVTALGAPTRAPEELIRLLVLRAGEAREVRTAVVSAEAAPAPGEEALRSYYAANADEYRAPELRTYRALIIDEAAVLEEAAATDEEVRQLFESRRAALNEPERRTFRQALFRDAETATAAAERVRGGEALADVAAELGASTTRSTGQTRADIVDAALAEAVFSADEPGVVGPVQGTFGTVIAMVEAIEPGTEVAFEDVQADLRAEQTRENVQRVSFDLVEEVENAFDGGASLEEAADAAGLPAPRAFGPVDADLFTPEGAIEASPGAVHRTAFTLGEGDLSDLVRLDDGGFAFVVVDEVRPEATRPFEEVSERVANDYAEAEAETALDAAIAAFRADVAGGTAFEAAAEARGSEVQSNTISASRPDPAVPTSLLREVFSADLGEVVSARTADGDQAVVAIVDGISFEGDPNAQALFGGYRDQVGGQIANELVDAYLRALETEFGVERDDAIIAQQFGLGG